MKNRCLGTPNERDRFQISLARRVSSRGRDERTANDLHLRHELTFPADSTMSDDDFPTLAPMDATIATRGISMESRCDRTNRHGTRDWRLFHQPFLAYRASQGRWEKVEPFPGGSVLDAAWTRERRKSHRFVSPINDRN